MVQVTCGPSIVDTKSPLITQAYPLMCGQRWLLRQYLSAPQNARPVQRLYRLQEPVDTIALLSAFRYVVASHPALRMELLEMPDGWRQSFPEVDAEIFGNAIEGGTSEARAAYARDLLANDSSKAFDLTSSPPFLARIIRVDSEHYFSLCLDHIAADDLAEDVFENELNDAYVRARENQEHPATRAGEHFFDYLNREISQKPKEKINLTYWREQLLGHPLTPEKTDKLEWLPGEVHQWEIVGAAFEKLRVSCRAHKASLSAAILGTFVRLLSELKGIDSIVVNVPVSNRTRVIDHGLIANLSMLLHLRFKLAGTSADPVFLVKVRDQLLEAMVHRHYDYDELSEAMNEAAAARNGRINWLVGCSYIIERPVKVVPGPLFAERLDNQPSASFDVPRGAFALTCRQNLTGLHFSADWDSSTWPAGKNELSTRFLEIASNITSTTLLV